LTIDTQQEKPPANAGTAEAGSVELRGVSKLFGAAKAVDDISLTVEAGEFISLLGPSGCGKTTLLRMIAGFEHPDAGDIRIGGQSVTGLPPNKRPVNTVFQSYALFPHMSVAENVGYGLRQQRVPKVEISNRVIDALRMARMEAFADRSPGKLSGGQQQRVALARALVNRPKVLLLDEPMSALDRKLREEMQLELTVLQAELGTTFIFVTHDQEEALTMSDRIVVLDQGHIQQLGSAEEIYSKPANLFVAKFIGKRNFLPVEVDSVGAVSLAGTTFGPGHSAVDEVRGKGVLAVRAEDISVSTAAPQPGQNAVSGKLVDIAYLGEVKQYLVRGADGVEILARTPPSKAEPVDFGDQVWCSWAPPAGQLFRADETEA
jgi:spermidine/putrescine transport system ATP-binding protein